MKIFCLVSVVSVDCGPPLGKTLGRNDTAISQSTATILARPHTGVVLRTEEREGRSVERGQTEDTGFLIELEMKAMRRFTFKEKVPTRRSPYCP